MLFIFTDDIYLKLTRHMNKATPIADRGLLLIIYYYIRPEIDIIIGTRPQQGRISIFFKYSIFWW